MKSKPKTVPELRFPGFVGEFKRNRLDVIVSKRISYGIVQAGVHVPDGMPYIKSQNLNDLLCLDELQRTSTTIARKYKRSEVVPGDIVFSLRGNIGVAQIVPESISVANLTQGTARISVRDDDNGFVCITLQTLDVSKQIQAFAKGSTFREISLDDLRKVTLALPSLPEQQKIANFLTALDQRIQQLRQKQSLLTEYKKGVMQQIFSQTLRFKDDQGNAFPDWVENRLGEISDVRDGTHASPIYQLAGYPLVTSKNLLKNGSLDLSNVDMISENDYLAFNQRSRVDFGDILFGMIGTIGNPVRVKETGYAIKNVALIKEVKHLRNSFLVHFLKSQDIERQFHIVNTGGTQKFIALGVIRKLLIRIPTLPEQTKIANFLTTLDRKIETVAQQISHTLAYKKGLLQQLFI